ncbi:hypothetical protein JCM8097_005195 [Rhodosporidiobolus ruineniae]
MAPKVALILTSHDKLISGKPTGWYLPELAHPYYVFKDAGVEVELVSVKGGKPPLDPSSVEQFKDDPECKKFQADEEVQKLLENTKALPSVKAEDYDAIFYVGGHGPVFDLTANLDSHQLILDTYAAGKPVSAVCHAPTALIECFDPKNGEYFVKNKKVTCFSNEEEEQAGLTQEIPFLVETALKGKGAIFQNEREAWGEEVVVDKSTGLLLTGANPASAGALAKAVVEALKK